MLDLFSYPSPPVRCLPFLAGGLLVLVLAAPTALAHEGSAFIHVPSDHVMPGEHFPLLGDDLDPDLSLELTLVHGETLVPLGRVATGPDGHFNTRLLLPDHVAHGYARLVASNPQAGDVDTWILVGPRNEGPGPSGTPVNQPDPLIDPSVLVLLVVVFLAIAAVGLALLRRGRGTTPGARRRRS
jgi:hypothetical protein